MSKSPKLKLRVDQDKCQGHARCKALGNCVSGTKPVKRSDLVKALRRLLGLTGAADSLAEIDLGAEDAAPRPVVPFR